MELNSTNMDWETINLPNMDNAGTRLAVVEEKVNTLHTDIHGEDGIVKQIRELQKTVWRATGVISLALFLFEVYAKSK